MRPIRTHLLSIVILFTLVNSIAFGQNSSSGSLYRFTGYSTLDGLSQSSVLSLIQDKTGYMWFGTGDGLNRFDGYSFKVFTNNNSVETSISDNGISSLALSSSGRLLIGTVNGSVNIYNERTREFKDITFPTLEDTITFTTMDLEQLPVIFTRLRAKSIISLVEDNFGFYWAGTLNQGLIRVDPRTGESIRFLAYGTQGKNLRSNRIKKLHFDRHGNLWIGTIMGGLSLIPNFELYALSQNSGHQFTFKTFGVREGLPIPSETIMDIASVENELLLASYGSGLIRLKYSIDFKNTSLSQVLFSNKLRPLPSDNLLTTIQLVQSGELWVGTFGSGMIAYTLSDSEYRFFVNEPNSTNSLIDNYVLSSYLDRSGLLWVGTHLGAGISKIEKTKPKFSVLRATPGSESSLNNSMVWSIFANDAELWVGTSSGGLNFLNRKTGVFSYFKHNPSDPNSLSDNHIRSIRRMSNGAFWIGTFGKGLNYFNPTTNSVIRYTHNPADSLSISGQQVLTMVLEGDSLLYIGTFGGGLDVARIDRRTGSLQIIAKYKHNPNDAFSLSDNRVYAMIRDSNGYIWVGTLGGGLNKFDPVKKTFTRFRANNAKNSLSDDRIISLHIDRSGFLLIGTFGGGLNRFDVQKNTFWAFNESNGFICDVVYGVFDDKKGNLWLSTNTGILKINPDLTTVTQFNEQDGVQSLEFSGGASFEAESGELFFGGINGLNFFYPDSVIENSFIPPVVISNISIFDRDISGEIDSLVLDYDKNFISFEIAALDFSHPEENRYIYTLEGLDNRWLEVNAEQRVISYTNLDPGTYTFRVRGSNNDGIWNNTGKAIVVIINPPFWREWWFILFATILFLAVLFLLYRFRKSNFERLEALKTKLAADLHDNVGAGLTEISILSELAATKQDDKEKQNEYLQTISQNARHLIDGMSDIVFVVNPSRDTLFDLISKLKDSYSDFLSNVGISFKSTSVEELQSVRLPMEVKQNIYLIFKEGLNNAIKHSECQRITLNVEREGGYLILRLTDDGKGFSSKKEISGNGLKNMETRARQIDAKIEINTSPYGTNIVLTAPIEPNSFFVTLKKKINELKKKLIND